MKERFECLFRPFWHVFAINKADRVQALKAYRQSRGIAPLLLHLGARWRWMVNTTPQPLYPRNPLNMKLRSPQNDLDVVENRTISYPVGIPTAHSSPSANLQDHLRTIENWAQKWRLKINETKSSHIAFTLRRGHCPPVYINQTVVPQASHL